VIATQRPLRNIALSLVLEGSADGLRIGMG
jgi:hypothetical protein